jgi:hypothetical protein
MSAYSRKIEADAVYAALTAGPLTKVQIFGRCSPTVRSPYAVSRIVSYIARHPISYPDAIVVPNGPPWLFRRISRSDLEQYRAWRTYLKHIDTRIATQSADHQKALNQGDVPAERIALIAGELAYLKSAKLNIEAALGSVDRQIALIPRTP